MKNISTFKDADWDIIATGIMNLTDGYPFLSWQLGGASTWYIYEEGAGTHILNPGKFSFTANNSDATKTHFTETWNVTISKENNNISKIPINFTGNAPNAENLEASTNETEGYGYSWININKTEMKVENNKTLYVPNINENNTLCILDKPDITEEEIKNLNTNNCENAVNASKDNNIKITDNHYIIHGLEHTGAKEIQPPEPTPTTKPATTTAAPGINKISIIALFIAAILLYCFKISLDE